MMEWISVKDRLPPLDIKGTCVVITSAWKRPILWGWLGHDWAMNINALQHIGRREDITHWLGPLPEVPNLDNENTNSQEVKMKEKNNDSND